MGKPQSTITATESQVRSYTRNRLTDKSFQQHLAAALAALFLMSNTHTVSATRTVKHQRFVVIQAAQVRSCIRNQYKKEGKDEKY
jgi:hypothetical protein